MNNQSKYVVENTPGVLSFVGPKGSAPVPLKDKEIKDFNSKETFSKKEQITEWEKIIFQNISKDEKKSTIDSLLEYCKYDTYSMIKIYNFLVNLS